MKDCVVKIGIKRSTGMFPGQSTSEKMSSPGGSTEAHSPPAPPGPDSDDDEDFVVPADLCSQHNYAHPPVDETRVDDDDTSTTEV